MIGIDPTWDQILSTLRARIELPEPLIQWAMTQILEGNADKDQIKSFLLALRDKGETAAEVNALVEAMYAKANLIDIKDRAVDIVGTGGDGANTINISTAAAIVTTAAGARTIKHGNRAATSKSGSADLLQSLGIEINLGAAAVAECVRKIGIGFAFAPQFHGAMRHAAQARKEIGVPTIFNILGPLANPAKPKAAAIGVANDRMHLVMAQVLAERGVEGFVFRGDDGLDEITLATTTSVLSIGNGEIASDRIDAKDFGISNAPISALVGGDAHENARITRTIFAGERGAPRDAVLLNAAAAIAAFDNELELSLHERINKSLIKASQAVDTGKASELLTAWVELSNQLVAD